MLNDYGFFAQSKMSKEQGARNGGQGAGSRERGTRSFLRFALRRLRSIYRCVRSMLYAPCLILLYHRVYEAQSDPQLLCVTPQHFAEHLEYLRHHYRIMSLSDLAKALKEGRLPKRSVVITFDDGYVDNLWNAKPLLERYEAPATVFVTTGYLGRMFWWDELERLLLQAQELPQRIKVIINGRAYEWDVSGEVTGQGYERWSVGCPDDPTPRHRAYRELHQLLRPLSREEQEIVLSQLYMQVDSGENRQTDARVMTAEEVRQLKEGGLIEIGSHSETHPVLSALPIEKQWKEILISKQRLEEILGHSVTSFSYPYGGRSDIGQDAIRFVQKAGYLVACANFPAFVTQRTDPFLLPRYLVRDWDGEEFARRVRGFFYG